jgi:hypothetical protein
MPTSDAQGKDVALDWYRMIGPSTVVDIGAGCGTYARLMRDEPNTSDTVRRAHPDGVHWTAIEAWEPYVAEYDLTLLYDQVLIGDVRHLAWPAFKADLVIAGDVLEHMTREQATTVLRRIKQGAANLIVSVPVLHLDQDAVNGNPYERHIDHWTAQAMTAELGAGIKDSWIGDTLAYWWWNHEEALGASGESGH